MAEVNPHWRIAPSRSPQKKADPKARTSQPFYLEELNRIRPLVAAPFQRDTAGVLLDVDAQRIRRLVRVAIFVDQEVCDCETIDELIDAFRIGRHWGDRLTAGLPEDLAGMASEHGSGASGVLVDPLAGGVEVGVSQALRSARPVARA